MLLVIAGTEIGVLLSNAAIAVADTLMAIQAMLLPIIAVIAVEDAATAVIAVFDDATAIMAVEDAATAVIAVEDAATPAIGILDAEYLAPAEITKSPEYDCFAVGVKQIEKLMP